MSPPAGNSGSWLNDLAVLQLVAPLEITPAPYQSPSASHTLGAAHAYVHMYAQPEYTAAAPCPLGAPGWNSRKCTRRSWRAPSAG